MKLAIRWIVVIPFLVASPGCFFSKDRPSPTPEALVEPLEEAPYDVIEEVQPPPAEEPLIEEALPKMEPAQKEETTKVEPLSNPLPGGQKLYEVVVLENTLKLTPPKITVQLGDTVRWTNQDSKKHFLASVPGSGKTAELEIFSLMDPGNIYEHTFKEAGVFPYFCFIHNQMTGRITVVR